MHESLVVTVIGADRPGIVARLSDVAASCDASWQESRLARLAGQFAGIVRLAVPAGNLDALEQALLGLEAEGLRFTLERSEEAPTFEAPRMLTLDFVGHDRPGIVRNISTVLWRHGVSIDELDTELESASMSGEQMFRAHARVLLPGKVSVDALRADLEAIADELVIDLTFHTRSAGMGD